MTASLELPVALPNYVELKVVSAERNRVLFPQFKDIEPAIVCEGVI